MKTRVTEIRSCGSRIKLLTLEPEDGSRLPDYTAGAHIDLKLGNGLIRQYSLWHYPMTDNAYRIAVLHEETSRGGSQYIHEHIRIGDILDINTPRNLFPLAEGKQRALLFAGGIGITPLMAMFEALLQQGVEVKLYYFCRNEADILFAERLQQADAAGKVELIHQSPRRSPELLSSLIEAPADGLHLYTCGPLGFMDAVFQTASAKGWPSENLHRELFQAAPLDESENRPFQVQIASNGALIDIPADKSITQVLEEEGYFVPVSCEEGICGTCLTHLVDGEVLHRDQFLTEEEHAEGKVFTPCCSRARSDVLVLDL
ncbi:Phthalate dioxygenase reductase [Bergeriella denitrificans]|uniref:Phthalate dioxygenase reductase n=2 Tax=Bergeriella denitrificans TaxID=494 RepID=A0A378UI07_BERDE|nr:Phthalate dioxygenase reductase [Bergeriella denitrificans]